MQTETDRTDIGVTWERATVYNFEQGANCPGSNRRRLSDNGRSRIVASLRGTCGGVCPNNTLPENLNKTSRRLQVGDRQLSTDVDGDITYDVVGTSQVDCNIPENCFDPTTSKCCGQPGCSCAIVSVSDCLSNNCDIMGGACCHSRFAEICSDTLACSCYTKNCGMV